MLTLAKTTNLTNSQPTKNNLPTRILNKKLSDNKLEHKIKNKILRKKLKINLGKQFYARILNKIGEETNSEKPEQRESERKSAGGRERGSLGHVAFIKSCRFIHIQLLQLHHHTHPIEKFILPE